MNSLSPTSPPGRCDGGALSALRLTAAASLALVAACLCISSAHAVTIDWVTVGNPGNANDPATGNQYGAVNYEYQIGKYEVTIEQYATFLNNVAATDTYSLYNPNMGDILNSAGISRSGLSGSYVYTVIGPSGTAPAGASSPGNRPITGVSWYNAARFANWMSNGQPTGAQGPTTTENGAYAISGTSIAPAMNAVNPNTGATPLYRIPTENEWYKAAFYSPLLNSGSGGYYAYATQNNTAPGNVIGGAANQANYAAGGLYSVTNSATYSLNQNYLTDVGAFTNSASYYGTFDQSGNAWEWNDLTGAAGSTRGLRGGGFPNDSATNLSSTSSATWAPSAQFQPWGFRLAVPVAVPEPSSIALAVAGLTCGGWSLLRRRRPGSTRCRAGSQRRPMMGEF